MSSSEDETDDYQSKGFSLNIAKYNNINKRSILAVRHRHGVSKGMSKYASDAKPLERAANKRGETTRDRPKKRSRNQHVLSNISINARKIPIPIPSFRMMKHTKKDDSHIQKLNKLERAFFDETSDEEDETENSNIQAKTMSDKAKKSSKQNVSLPSRQNGNDLSIIVEEGSVGSESELCSNRGMDSPRPGSDDKKDIDDTKREDERYTPSNSGTEDHIPEESEMEPGDPNQESWFAPSQPQSIPKQSTGEDSHAVQVEEEDTASGFGFGGDDDEPGGELVEISEKPAPTVDHEGNLGCGTMTTIVSSNPLSEDPPQRTLAPKSPNWNIEHQVDLLFTTTDTTTITMNMFCRTLEGRLGVTLEKATKKHVKKRVMSLLRGEIKPGIEGNNISVNDNGKSNTTFPTKVGDAGKTPEMNVHGVDSNSTVVMRPSSITIQPNTGADSETTPSHRESVTDSIIPNEVIKSLSASMNDIESKQHKAAKMKGQSSSAELCKQTVTGGNNELIIVDDDADDSSIIQNETHITKLTDVIIPEKGADKQLVNLEGNKLIEEESARARKMERTEGEATRAKTTKPNKRARKPRKKASRETTNEETKDEPTTSSTAQVRRPRKRPRSTATACALCKTCPCQKPKADTETAVIAGNLDMMKSFSRSHGAIENTLIRRLLKLEQSTENLAEQTEGVRRRLKKHRREGWKRMKRQELANSTDDGLTANGASYFLPDAEVFDQVQTASNGMPRRLVHKAQNRLFQNVPTYQPTLFEIIGIPRDGDKSKTKTDGDPKSCTEGQNEENEGPSDGNAKPSAHSCAEGNDDDDIPTEYVPDQQLHETIHRVRWNNSGKEEPEVPTGSIFDTIHMLTQDERKIEASNTQGEKNKKSHLPLWDQLFKPKVETATLSKDGTGLNDLFYLFQDGADHADQSPIEHEEKIEEADHQSYGERVDVSILSQEAQSVANNIVTNISSTDRIHLLEESCPDWKENIYFAMMQKDPGEIQIALENVRKSRIHMEEEKKRLLALWESKSAALDVFETALQRSAERSVRQKDEDSENQMTRTAKERESTVLVRTG